MSSTTEKQVAAISDQRSDQSPVQRPDQHPELRSFREAVAPQKSLTQVAQGAGMDKSHLSRLEMGKQGISLGTARSLAGFYSRVAGRPVTVDEIVSMAEQSAARHAEPQGSLKTRSSGAMEAPEV